MATHEKRTPDANYSTVNDATKFVDATCLLRMLGEDKTGTGHGVTRESVQAMLVDVAKENFVSGPYGCWLTFRDGSCAAQVRAAKRWEVYR